MLFVSLLGVAGLRGPGCGGDDAAHGPNAPCTRSKDCTPGLLCVNGVCEDPVPDASSADGEGGLVDSDAGDAGDG